MSLFEECSKSLPTYGSMKDEIADFQPDSVKQGAKRHPPTNDDTYDDSPSDMLLSRRIARSLSRYSWYHPGKYDVPEGKEPPSLDKAWAHFEHVTLGRHIHPEVFASSQGEESPIGLEEEQGFLRRSLKSITSLRSFRISKSIRDHLHMSIPGETGVKTSLYPFFASEADLADFGVGVGLYFSTLRIMAVIFMFAFLMNFIVIWFYAQGEYSDSQPNVPWTIQGSLACTKQKFFPCPNCDHDSYNKFPPAELKFARADSDESLTFIKVNLCESSFWYGFWPWLASLVVILLVTNVIRKSNQIAIEFDESEQTATDYSIVISNPPKDARDPKEWKAFFKNAVNDAKMTLCTIVLNNDPLVNALCKKKNLLLKLDYMLAPGDEMDETKLKELVDRIPPMPWWKKLFNSSPISLYEKIPAVQTEIDELSKKTYDVSNVYISFETEQMQREVLTKFSFGKWTVARQNVGSLPENVLFRGKHVLKVFKPVEPSAVHWLELNETKLAKTISFLITSIASFALICIGGIVIYVCQGISGKFFGYTVGSFAITAFNTITPQVVKFLMKFEKHRSEGSMQRSLFIKICLFRYVNSCLIIKFITPFVYTLEWNSFLTIQSLLFTEIYMNPLLLGSDYMGHFNRHVLGPRARDQRRMNLLFSGMELNLAERFTDMNKVIFIVFFYAALFPSGFLYGSIALIAHYFTGRLLLLRSCAVQAKVGTKLPNVSNAFIILSLLAYFFMNSVTWYNFPFDNACIRFGERGQEYYSLIDRYIGTYDITDLEGDQTLSVTVTNETEIYIDCNQNSLRFPTLSRTQNFQNGMNWMTEDQALIVDIAGVTSAIVVLALVIYIIWETYWFMKSLFYPHYKPSGKLSGLKFSTQHIRAYIPEVRFPGYVYPFLFCDISKIEKRFVGWVPAHGNFDAINLIYEVPSVKAEKDQDNSDVTRNLFSTVVHWPQGEDDDE